MPIDPLALFVALPAVLLTITFVIVLRRSSEGHPEDFSVEEIDDSFELYTRATWITTIALIVVFTATGFQLATSIFNVGPSDAILGEVQAWGYAEGFRQFVGASQIAASLFLLFPRTAMWAAGYLSVVMGGAIYTQIAAQTYVYAAYPLLLLLGLAFVAYERYLWRRSKGARKELPQTGPTPSEPLA